jgi:glycoprotein 3-alpha-L-fucosyltransferase
MKIFQNNNQNTDRFNLLDTCEYKNCFFACDKNFINDSDVLMFHYSDLYYDIDNYKEDYEKLIRKRNNEKIWLLYNDEAFVYQKRFDYLKFNWTMTFYFNSEVSYFAYGGMSNVQTDENKYTIEKIKLDFDRRFNSAVWFVSNCERKKRLEFAAGLGKYFSLIIIGECSKLVNGEKIINKNTKCPRGSTCESDNLMNSKFYLAFESVNCSDYITEKFWRTLSFDLIPVVFQPSRQSYERIAPPNSFIHAQDFNFNHELLAQYLVKVSNDLQLYFSYLEWKIRIKTYFKAEDVEKRRMCQLCKKLNTERSSIYYDSMSDWFKKQCKSP